MTIQNGRVFHPSRTSPRIPAQRPARWTDSRDARRDMNPITGHCDILLHPHNALRPGPICVQHTVAVINSRRYKRQREYQVVFTPRLAGSRL